MVSSTENRIERKLSDALEAYGLTPGEVGATVELVTTLGSEKNEFNSDSLRLQIGTKKVIDTKRSGEVEITARKFVEDLVNAAGINMNSHEVRFGASKHRGFVFTFDNVAACSEREGPNRAINDVWYGLEQMIEAKKHDQQPARWSSRV
jgi:hypothetical protein